jgi:cytochrome c2
MKGRTILSLAGACLIALAAACARAPNVPDQVVANGNATRGRDAINRFGCGSCHDIPGIDGAHGMVGPPLDHWAQRRIIAGEVENTPDHLITWLTTPQAIEPGNAMPNMGITDGEARDMAAYLYSIK